MKKGFTLIELLAVIIILAIIALIATSVVLKVVDNAKESATKSSVVGYADAVKLTITGKTFENSGLLPAINEEFLSSITYQGSRVTCNEVKNTNNYGIILKECMVAANPNLYCFAKGKVYSCDDIEFTNIYNNINESVENNGVANAPVLYTNMIPVSYDGTNWIYADVTQKWYDYDSKEWANTVVLNSGVTKNVGDSISMSDISQMYVWIPRYKYTIFNGNNGSAAAQEINIVFESGTNSTGTVSCTDAVSGSGSSSEICTDSINGSVTDGTSTYTHPAFTFGATKLTGIWVGKFELSNITSCTAANHSVETGCDLTTLGIQIKPNVKSWRGARVSTFFTVISNIASTYSINADSHMMKGMEWGAVAYLSTSKYGLSTTDIGINNNSSYKTGCGAHSGNYSSMTCNYYNTTNGMLASTTGNITGIYDMSGGAQEYVMGDTVYKDGITMTVGYTSAMNSGFTGKLFDGTSFSGIDFPDSKYYDAYTTGTSYTTYSRGKLGDATKETMVTYGSYDGGWYGDTLYFPSSFAHWFVRGNEYDNGPRSGLFSLYYDTADASNTYGTRAVLTESN